MKKIIILNKKNGKKTGEIVSENGGLVYSFSGDIAPFSIDEERERKEKFGFINSKGNIIFFTQFDKIIYNFKNDIAVTMIDNKFGFIRRNNIVRYSRDYIINNGFSKFDDNFNFKKIIRIQDNYYIGFLDYSVVGIRFENGEIVDYRNLYINENELYAFENFNFLIIKNGDFFKLKDLGGKDLDLEFKDFNIFENGFWAVKDKYDRWIILKDDKKYINEYFKSIKYCNFNVVEVGDKYSFYLLNLENKARYPLGAYFDDMYIYDKHNDVFVARDWTWGYNRWIFLDKNLNQVFKIKDVTYVGEEFDDKVVKPILLDDVIVYVDVYDDLVYIDIKKDKKVKIKDYYFVNKIKDEAGNNYVLLSNENGYDLFNAKFKKLNKNKLLHCHDDTFMGGDYIVYSTK